MKNIYKRLNKLNCFSCLYMGNRGKLLHMIMTKLTSRFAFEILAINQLYRFI